MTVPVFLKRARRFVVGSYKGLLNRFDTPVVVLIYHRVTTLLTDPQLLAVSPENFRRQMGFLRDNYPVLRFEEDWSQVREPSVVITFDDGYADNALEAVPILEEVGVPATFFVSSGYVGSNREFWWDDLERLILLPPDLPQKFTTTATGRSMTWDLSSQAHREKMYSETHRQMMKVTPEVRERWLTDLHLWAGVPAEARESHRAVTVEELRRLSARPMATVGAHTVSHAPLSSLASEEQFKEISSSRLSLESWIGGKVETFSYPFGRKADYNRHSLSACRRLGFARVASNFPGQAHRWTSPYEVPRNLVRNWPVEVFAQRMKDFLIS